MLKSPGISMVTVEGASGFVTAAFDAGLMRHYFTIRGLGVVVLFPGLGTSTVGAVALDAGSFPLTLYYVELAQALRAATTRTPTLQ